MKTNKQTAKSHLRGEMVRIYILVAARISVLVFDRFSISEKAGALSQSGELTRGSRKKHRMDGFLSITSGPGFVCQAGATPPVLHTRARWRPAGWGLLWWCWPGSRILSFRGRPLLCTVHSRSQSLLPCKGQRYGQGWESVFQESNFRHKCLLGQFSKIFK